MARDWRDLYDEDIIRRVENRDYENGGPDAIRMNDEDYAKTLYNSSLWEGADPAGRAALHDENERIRSGYDYSGGAAGNEYIRTGAAAPVRTDNWQNTVADLQQKLINYGSYVDPYRSGLDAKYDAIVNRQPFSYDLENDPNWKAYQKQYTRAGQRAYDDALARLSARTGGLASSYAGAQAQQAYNGYMQQMTDKIPELYKLAYDMYASDAQRDITDLNAIRGLSSDAYDRWLGDYNMLGNNLGLAESARAYQDAQDAAKIYAYGDGDPYEIGSGKGQYFVLNAAPGATMTGGDGSVWTKNPDGSVTITRGGQTWTIAAPAPTYTGSSGRSRSEDEEEEPTSADGARHAMNEFLAGQLAAGNSPFGVSPFANNGPRVSGRVEVWPGEGYVWRGKEYATYDEFKNAVNEADLSDEEFEQLIEDLRYQGINPEIFR